MKQSIRRTLQFSCVLVLCLLSISSFAQKGIEGIWFSDKKDAKIKIYKDADGKYNGKIVWLKSPDRDGKPKLDTHNEKEALRTRPVLGLVILKDFEKDGDEYEDGTIYNPEDGKTYSCRIKQKGPDKLDVRGYIGISLIGKSTTFYRAE